MKQEEKELLLKDLCGRLPYGVICYGVTKDTDEDGNYTDKGVTNILYELHSYKCCYGLVGLMNECDIESIKPYLRPISSMTEEEMEELKTLCSIYIPTDSPNIGFEEYGIVVFTHHLINNTYSFKLNVDVIDWLNKNMFDYRGLIEMGLAIVVTKENNPYKE